MAKSEPKTRSRKKAPTLRGLGFDRDPMQVWFSRDACIVRRGTRRELVFHGTLAASWEEGETAIRNALLVQLAQEPRIVLEDLARAFGLSSEAVRLIRRKAEAEGRGFWESDEAVIDRLHEVVDDVENRLEGVEP